MIREKLTQRLFWKKWPYKVILGNDTFKASKAAALHSLKFPPQPTLKEDQAYYSLGSGFTRWFKNHYPDYSMRKEYKISVFLDTREQVDHIIDNWGKHVLEVWAPANPNAVQLMKDHIHDIIRERPWYNEFSIRARIPYTHELRTRGIDDLRQAVKQVERGWHAGGVLHRILNDSTARIPYSYGQPMYLYLKDNEDAIMLRLQLNEWIDRFERQRPP
jgi:hypothetical protein